MITNDHLNEEVKTIEAAYEAEKNLTFKALLKGILLMIKLGRNTRTNTMLIMKKLGIDMIKPKTEGTKV